MADTILHDIRIPLDDEISPEIRRHMFERSFELAEAQAAFRLLKPEDVVLELGGGCGFLAVYCAKRCHHVVTVEADLRMWATIRRTFAANGVFPGLIIGAVSRSGAALALQRSPDFWATQTRARCSDAEPSPELVRGYALSHLLDRVRPTVLICDIEGGELDLVGERLPGVRAVIVEYHHGSQREVDPWLEREGFSLVPSERTDVATWVRTAG